MLEKLDELIFGRGKLFVYVIGIFLIIYLDKWDLEKVLKFIWLIGQITILWCLIKILRIYLINYVKKLNRFFFKKIPIIIKLRKYIIDIPLLLRIILSFYIFFDWFLIKILFLETRKKNLFYFLRRFLYLNLLIWISLPFYFIKELYNIVLTVIESDEITVKNIFWLRAHFLFLTIICVLLLNIERIDILIAAWVIDTVVIKIYYEWWKEFKEMNKLKIINWRIYCIYLNKSFYQIEMNYNEYCTSIIMDIDSLRKNVLLVYKGLTKEEIELCKIEFIEKLIKIYDNWWNNYYIQWTLDKSYGFRYYDSINDEHFILDLLAIGVEQVGEEENDKIKLDKQELFEFYIDTLDKRFHPKQYNLLLAILKKLNKDTELLNQFFKLKREFDFSIYREDFLQNEEVKKFCKKLFDKKE